MEEGTWDYFPYVPYLIHSHILTNREKRERKREEERKKERKERKKERA